MRSSDWDCHSLQAASSQTPKGLTWDRPYKPESGRRQPADKASQKTCTTQPYAQGNKSCTNKQKVKSCILQNHIHNERKTYYFSVFVSFSDTILGAICSRSLCIKQKYNYKSCGSPNNTGKEVDTHYCAAHLLRRDHASLIVLMQVHYTASCWLLRTHTMTTLQPTTIWKERKTLTIKAWLSHFWFGLVFHYPRTLLVYYYFHVGEMPWLDWRWKVVDMTLRWKDGRMHN